MKTDVWGEGMPSVWCCIIQPFDGAGLRLNPRSLFRCIRLLWVLVSFMITGAETVAVAPQLYTNKYINPFGALLNDFFFFQDSNLTKKCFHFSMEKKWAHYC